MRALLYKRAAASRPVRADKVGAFANSKHNGMYVTRQCAGCIGFLDYQEDSKSSCSISRR